MSYRFGARNAISLGPFSASTLQQPNAIALGAHAGRHNQGSNSIAIGTNAGHSNQHASTIVLNATGLAVNTLQDNSTYLTPVRQTSSPYLMTYSDTTKEVTYGNNLSGSLGIGTTNVGSNTLQVNGTSRFMGDVSSDTGTTVNFGNALKTADTDLGYNGASFTTTAGELPSGVQGGTLSGTYRLTALSGYGSMAMAISALNASYVVGAVYQYTFTGLTGSSNMSLSVLQNTSMGIISSTPANHSITTASQTITGCFIPSNTGGKIAFNFQALAANPFVNWTTFSLVRVDTEVTGYTKAPVLLGDNIGYASRAANPLPAQTTIKGLTTSQRLLLGSYYTGGVGACSVIQSSDYYSSLDHGGFLLLNPLGGNVGIGTDSPSSKFYVKDGRIDLQTSQGRFNGLLDWSDAGRAQIVLSSYYSDLVIASSQFNELHGSTLTFVSYNPSNYSDYRKWVINQGNWGSRLHMLDFGYGNWGGATNPHSVINGGDTVLTLDGVNKRVGIGSTNPGSKLDVAGDTRVTGMLNIGNISTNYNSAWSPNILLNCLDQAEITVHDAGARVVSAMHYNGGNRIYIGRDLGWGSTPVEFPHSVVANEVYTSNWFRVYGGGVHWEWYGRGIWSPESAGNSFGNIATYGGGRNNWMGYGIGSRHCVMGNNDTVGIHDNSNSWCIEFNGSRYCLIHGGCTIYNSLTVGNKDGSFSYWGTSERVNYIRGGKSLFDTSTDTYWHLNWYYDAYSPGAHLHNAPGTWAVSIWATGAIVTNYWFGTVSDRRIKTNIKPVGNMLEIINKIQVVSFDFIDPVNNKRDECGVIAQQVEEVFPNIVDRSVGIIPNIMKRATSFSKCDKTLKIHYMRDNDMDALVIGSRVQLMIGIYGKTPQESKGYGSYIVNVICIEDEFIIVEWTEDINLDGSSIVVYGKEVDDFRNIDKEQFGVMAIKGIQELSEKMEQLTQQKNILEERVGVIEKEFSDYKIKTEERISNLTLLIQQLANK